MNFYYIRCILLLILIQNKIGSHNSKDECKDLKNSCQFIESRSTKLTTISLDSFVCDRLDQNFNFTDTDVQKVKRCLKPKHSVFQVYFRLTHSRIIDDSSLQLDHVFGFMSLKSNSQLGFNSNSLELFIDFSNLKGSLKKLIPS